MTTPPLPPPSSDGDAELASRVARVLAPAYIVEREVGRGGMGIVYRARDARLKRAVAVKVLPPELAYRPEIRSRFLREAEMAAQLSQPNIVPIYTVDERDGLVYFVMAFVEGETLGDRLARGPLPVADARRIMRQIAEALAYAHARGVIHRDIKPDNILLATDGDNALVSDFGIARAVDDSPTDPGAAAEGGSGTRLTATGVAIGTPAYMSPEQCAGDRTIDGRSDLYGLGVLAYHMLAGRPPFTGGNSASLLVKQLTERPVPLRDRRADVPADLSAIVMRLLEKDPANRFPDAGAVVRALDGQPFTLPAQAAESAFSHVSRDAIGRITYNGQLISDVIQSSLDRAVAKRGRRRNRKNRGGDDDSGELAAIDRDAKDKPVLSPEEQLAKRGRKYRMQVGGWVWTSAVCISVNYMTSPHAWWAQWAVFGLGVGVVTSTARLWADGINPFKILMASIGHPGVPKGVLTPGPRAAEGLVPPAVLNGPFGAVVRRAAADRVAIVVQAAQLSEVDRKAIPDVVPTADKLVDQIATLANALHRIDEGGTVPPALADRRAAFAAQLERASLALQTLLLDIMRLRSGGLESIGAVTSATQEANALSREIGYVLGAADELRNNDRR